MKFRVHYMTADAIPHVCCRIFAADQPGTTYAALGNLTMRKPEFAAFRALFNAEFINDIADAPSAGAGRGASEG